MLSLKTSRSPQVSSDCHKNGASTMPWNEPGGDKDPWKSKNNNQSPAGLDDLIEKVSNFFSGSPKNNNDDEDNGSGASILILLIIGLAIWAFTGFYTIDERERGVVLRFGEHTETTTAGLHWHLPYPIEKVEAVDVDSTRTAKERTVMLTKDENIVDLAVSVQYKISSVEDYLFNVANTDNVNSQTGSTLHQVMRSAIREIVGRNTMDSIIKDGREQIAQDTSKVMQEILDEYKAGITVNKVNLTYAEAPEEVKDAFDDANRARENMNQYRNEALAYQKKVVPRARGRAARITEEAEGYKAQIIAESEGEAERFNQLVAAYQKAPEVTRQRLYLETMEDVLGKTNKVMVDANSGNNIMMLPLDKLNTTPTSKDNEQERTDQINTAAAKKAKAMVKSRNANRTSTRTPRTIGGR